MMKLLKLPFQLTTAVSLVLSAVIIAIAAITWLAASAAISFVAPKAIYAAVGLTTIAVLIAVADRWQWYKTRQANAKRDQAVASAEALRAKIDADRYQMQLMFEGRLMAATVRQVEQGLLHAGSVGGVDVAAVPARIINQIGAGEDVGASVPMASLPPKVDLSQLIPAGPSLDRLAIGLEAKEGELQPVAAPLSSLVHVGVGGSSGWGKTVFLQSLAIQLVLSPEPVEMVFIDVEEQSFTPFSGLSRENLRYPVANDEADILSILDDLRGEWHRRRRLFREYPEVDNLAAYNAVSPAPIPPIVLMLDEVNMLTDNKDIVAALTKLGQGTRKYGIYCVIGGQNWNAESIPTKLRDNFSTRIQLRAMSRSQSNVMLADGAAADITSPGRAYAIIPGRVMAEIQTPYISKADIIKALTGRLGNGPTMPEVVMEPEPETGESEIVAKFEALRDGPDKFTWRRLTQDIYGPGVFGKDKNNAVRSVLTRFNVDYSEYMTK